VNFTGKPTKPAKPTVAPEDDVERFFRTDGPLPIPTSAQLAWAKANPGKPVLFDLNATPEQVRQVDEEQRRMSEQAREFLRRHGLLKD
jgi:hypothetical protein